MGVKLIKISVVYLVIGVLLGYYMSIAHDYQLTGVHVHINLVGWTALTLIGILYHLFPALVSNGLAKTHFWLHNIGLPIMMIALYLLLAFGESTVLTASVATGATLTVLAIITFAVNVFKNLKA
ncbi:cytochrome-c oxidase [Domibacillus mangrovi]|uniref:Cytochrome-c oxidase n=1 Tax=Domibacillus mangrovi TaxID=1714354 RepID=A0A1Q5P5Y8_9BACI|nr:cytochrome-c oxidase [Domibacillus mangrovi]OKL37644.1 cytochrome-c oxidase [Domibacillus mangrovi]